jgi:hypothetical protein
MAKKKEKKMSWFNRGVEGYQKAQDERAKEIEERGKFDRHRDLWTWYVSKEDAKNKQARKIVFLTSVKNMISTYVHETPKVPGNWSQGVWRLTCPKMADPSGQTRCPLCERDKEYPKLRTFLAMVDVTGYEKDGNKFMPVKYLLASPATMDALFLDIDPENGGNGDILGMAYAVSRSFPKGSSQGNTWKSIKQFDLQEFAQRYNKQILPSVSRFPKEWGFIANPDDDPANHQVVLKDLPWESIFAPETPEAIASLTGFPLRQIGASSTSSSAGSDPFADGGELADADFPDAPF